MTFKYTHKILFYTKNIAKQVRDLGNRSATLITIKKRFLFAKQLYCLFPF